MLASCSDDDERVSANSSTKTVSIAIPTANLASPTPLIATAGSRPFVADPTTVVAPTPAKTKGTATTQNSPTVAKLTAANDVRPSPGITATLGTPGVAVYKPEDTAAALAAALNKQNETRVVGMPMNLEQVKAKLKSLLLAMKATGPDELIEAADLSASGQLDIIATFAQNWTKPPLQADSPGYLLVLHQAKGSWTPFVYRKPDDAGVQSDFSQPTLIKVINLNKSRYPQIVFSEQHCSTLSCTSAVRILSWYNNKWYDLTPTVPEMENVERIGFENRDNDGSLALIISGGITKANDAGPQRRRTEVYRYDAAAASFRLSETTFEASDYLYFRVLDGNDALARQHYDDAIAYYIDAVYNDKLKSWSKEQGGSFEAITNERAALVAFARFRLGVTYLLKGERQKASDIFTVALNHDNDYKLWTQAFIAPYQDHPAKATVAEGCAGAIKLSQQHPEMIQPLNNFGYTNPLFKPEDICPQLGSK